MSRPLVYYAISLIIGLISSVLFLTDYFLLGAVFTASFLSIFFFTVSRKYFIVILTIYILGLINSFLYYKLPEGNIGNVRVIEKKNYYSLGEYKNKKFIIDEDIKDIKEGEVIYCSFTLNKRLMFSKAVLGEMKNVKVINRKEDLITKLHEYREYIFKRFEKSLGKRYSAVLSGICFGYDKHIYEEDLEDFNTLGIIHVISVSGFHIILIYKLFEVLLTGNISLIITLFFVCFTGGKAPTLRAYIMIILMSLSKKFYKSYDVLSSLSFTVMLLLFIKPYYITDIGFNLSWLSTLGIILFNKKFSRYLYKLPSYINKSISITLSAQTLSFPYASVTLKTFSPGFLFGNLFIIPIYSLIIYISFLSIILMPFPELFHLVNKLIFILFKAVDIWIYMLIYFSPDKYHVNSAIIILYTAIFISIIITKRHIKSIRLLPLFLFFPALLWDYYFIPYISISEIGSSRFIRLSYKNQNYIFTTSNTDKLRVKLSKHIEDPAVINIKNQRYIIKLSNSETVTLEREINARERGVSLIIKSSSFGRETQVYDIINMHKEYIDLDYSIKNIEIYRPLAGHIFISGMERRKYSDRH